MPVTTAALAAELDVTVDTVDTLVGQIVDIDGPDAVVITSGRYYTTITDEAADTVREQLRGEPADPDPLLTVAEATQDLRDAQAQVDEAEARRDAAVRAAIERGMRIVDIAEAAGLTRGRVYQIRDGVR
jgi:hypothetical protein